MSIKRYSVGGLVISTHRGVFSVPVRINREFVFDYASIAALSLMLSGPELKAMLEAITKGLVEASTELSGSAPSDRLRIAGALDEFCDKHSLYLSWSAPK